jgi:hypothetical protein
MPPERDPPRFPGTFPIYTKKIDQDVSVNMILRLSLAFSAH